MRTWWIIFFRFELIRPLAWKLALPAFFCLAVAASAGPTDPIETVPEDTESLIDRKGLPVASVPVHEDDDESRLLLYDDGDTMDGLLIDVAYLVDGNGDVEKKIVRSTPQNTTDDEKKRKKWYSETVSELKDTVETLKETKKSIDQNIHALPGLNYFDRVDVLSKEMELEIGKSSNETRTTFVYQPSKDYVSFTLRVPLGP